LENEIAENKEKIAILEEEINAKKGKKEGLNQNKEKFVKELEEKEGKLKKLTENMSEKELEMEKKKVLKLS